jgi:hypothetical protein
MDEEIIFLAVLICVEPHKTLDYAISSVLRNKCSTAFVNLKKKLVGFLKNDRDAEIRGEMNKQFYWKMGFRFGGTYFV